MPTQAPPKPPLREQFTLEGVEQLVKTFLDLQHNVFEAAGRFGLTLAELEEVLAWPEARELLERAQRLSALRTQPALDLIFPCAIDRLASVMFDENAPAEARRKSAALLARICESRRRDRRLSAAPRRPASTTPAADAPPPSPSAPPPPRETTTHDDIVEELLPAPLLRYIPADPAPQSDSAIEDTALNIDNSADDNDPTPPRARRAGPTNLPPLATFPLPSRAPAGPVAPALAHASDTS